MKELKNRILELRGKGLSRTKTAEILSAEFNLPHPKLLQKIRYMEDRCGHKERNISLKPPSTSEVLKTVDKTVKKDGTIETTIKSNNSFQFLIGNVKSITYTLRVL